MFCAQKPSGCRPCVSFPESELFPCNHWPVFPHCSPGYESNQSFPHQDPREAARNTLLTSPGAGVHHAESQQIERELSPEVNWNQKFGTCEVVQLIMCNSSLVLPFSCFHTCTTARRGLRLHADAHLSPENPAGTVYHCGHPRKQTYMLSVPWKVAILR